MFHMFMDITTEKNKCSQESQHNKGWGSTISFLTRKKIQNVLKRKNMHFERILFYFPFFLLNLTFQTILSESIVICISKNNLIYNYFFFSVFAKNCMGQNLAAIT